MDQSPLKVGVRPKVHDSLWDAGLVRKDGLPRTKRGMKRRPVGAVMSASFSNRTRLKQTLDSGAPDPVAPSETDLRAALSEHRRHLQVHNPVGTSSTTGQPEVLAVAENREQGYVYEAYAGRRRATSANTRRWQEHKKETEFSQTKRPWREEFNTLQRYAAKWESTQSQAALPARRRGMKSESPFSKSHPVLETRKRRPKNADLSPEADPELLGLLERSNQQNKQPVARKHYRSVMLRYEAEFRELYHRHGNKPAPFQERTELCFQLLDDLFDRLDASEEYQNIGRSLRDELFASVFTSDKNENLVAYFDLVRAIKGESLRLAKDNMFLRKQVAEFSDSAAEALKLRNQLTQAERRLNDAEDTMKFQASLISTMTKTLEEMRRNVHSVSVKVDNLL